MKNLIFAACLLGGLSAQALELVDEVHFYHDKTAMAIRMCKEAREQDRRCSMQNLTCHPCSEIDHSDHSSYKVYNLGYGGGRPGDGRRDDRVMAMCSAIEIDRYGYDVYRYSGRAESWNFRDAETEACRIALRECDYRKSYSNSCVLERERRVRPTPPPYRDPGYPRPPSGRREVVETYHFRDNQTAEAYRKCVAYRSQLRECTMHDYTCSPCTQESHTDHSEFTLYKLW